MHCQCFWCPSFWPFLLEIKVILSSFSALHFQPIATSPKIGYFEVTGCANVVVKVKVSVAWKTFFWLFGCFLLVSYPASGIGINVCRDYSFLTLKGMCIQHYPDAIGTLKWHFRNRVHKHFWVPDNCYSLLFLLEEYLFYFTVICNMICDFSAAPLWRQMNCHETDNEKQKRCTQAQWGENKES